MTFASLNDIQKLFIPPEKTIAQIPFGNPPNPPTFKESCIVIYGVPFDDTATFGKGSDKGPRGLRHASGRQIETYMVDEDIDIYEEVPILDLGDFIIQEKLNKDERKQLYQGPEKEQVITKLKRVLKQFNALEDITCFLVSKKKIPVMIGGEHTLSYWPLRAIAKYDPVVIHFDAHRDAKDEYEGVRLCHTTPMYHFLQDCKNKYSIDFVQIGIRQTDKYENKFAKEIGIKTFYPRDVKKDIARVCQEINSLTNNRNVYVTFDIDALDICYTPCTGTPEPFGLTPDHVIDIFQSINSNAKLIGADMMEVAVKNKDYKEATTATQILLRLFARSYVRREP